MKKLAMSPIYKMGKSKHKKKDPTSLDDMIVQVYWTSVKPNGKEDIPISKALLGEKVFLAIKTKGIPDGINFLARIYEHNRMTSNRRLIESDFTIKNGFGATDALYLEKSQKWINMLKETRCDEPDWSKTAKRYYCLQ